MQPVNMLTSVKAIVDDITEVFGADSKVMALFNVLMGIEEAELQELNDNRLMKMLQCEATESVSASQYMVSVLDLLELHFKFVDGQQEKMLNSIQMMDAFEKNMLQHPFTGEPVINWTQHVVMFYTPTKKLLDLRKTKQ